MSKIRRDDMSRTWNTRIEQNHYLPRSLTLAGPLYKRPSHEMRCESLLIIFYIPSVVKDFFNVFTRLTGLPYLADRETRPGGSPHLSCKRDQNKVRSYRDRRVTSPTWGPPPPGKQAHCYARSILFRWQSGILPEEHGNGAKWFPRL